MLEWCGTDTGVKQKLDVMPLETGFGRTGHGVVRALETLCGSQWHHSAGYTRTIENKWRNAVRGTGKAVSVCALPTPPSFLLNAFCFLLFFLKSGNGTTELSLPWSNDKNANRQTAMTQICIRLCWVPYRRLLFSPWGALLSLLKKQEIVIQQKGKLPLCRPPSSLHACLCLCKANKLHITFLITNSCIPQKSRTSALAVITLRGLRVVRMYLRW